MRPTEILAAYRRKEMGYLYALKALMMVGFGYNDAEGYLS